MRKNRFDTLVTIVVALCLMASTLTGCLKTDIKRHDQPTTNHPPGPNWQKPGGDSGDMVDTPDSVTGSAGDDKFAGDDRFTDDPFFVPPAHSTVLSTKRVGRPNYGYFYIPQEWVVWTELDSTADMLQYCDPTGQAIITVYNYPGISDEVLRQLVVDMGEGHRQKGWTDITYAIVELDGYQTYQTSCYYPNQGIYLVLYFFIGDDGLVHYIAVEGPPDMIMLVVGTIEITYSLTE